MKKNILFASLSMSILIACNSGKKEETATVDPESKRYDLALKDLLGPFERLAQSSEKTGTEAEKIKLGHALYYDVRLSKNNTISCNSCHNLAKGGVDNLPTSPGDAGQNGDRNSPTVLNAALHSMQFWDGRAADIEEQAGMPILNPVEMAIPSEKFLVDRLSAEPMYREMFKKAYPGEGNPITYTNIRKAIGAFERELITPSRFDRYLAGETEALTVKEKKGLMTFVNVGCTTCHYGPLLGGNSFQKFGVHDDYWKHTNSTKIDEGLFSISKKPEEKFMFKTPSLRNIAETSPYFHDGSVKELDKAVKIMAKVQLNYELNNSEVENLVAFLQSLSGDIKPAYKIAPAEVKQTAKL